MTIPEEVFLFNIVGNLGTCHLKEGFQEPFSIAITSL